MRIVSSFILFENSLLEGLEEISIESETRFFFDNTVIKDVGLVNVLQNSFFDPSLTSFLSNIGKINILFNSSMIADNSLFDNSPIFAEDEPVIAINDCFLGNSNLFPALEIKDGLYSGMNNFYDNNITAVKGNNTTCTYLDVRENSSTITNHSGVAFELIEAFQAMITNNEFSYNSGIHAEGGSGGSIFIDNNSITFGNDAISIRSRGNVVLTNNNITVDNNNSNIGTGIVTYLCEGPLIEGNTVTSSYPSGVWFGGIRVWASPNANVKENFVSLGYNNYEIVDSEDSNVESNQGFSSPWSNMYTRNSDNSKFCGNTLEKGLFGLRVSGISPGSEIVDNHLIDCSVGLRYDNDVMIMSQIEKGNDFSGNTLGAEFLDQSDPNILSASSFIVQNNPSEYPTVSPQENWFLPMGSDSEECPEEGISNPSYPPVYELSETMLYRIDVIGEEEPDFKGRKEFLTKHTADFIKKYPSTLSIGAVEEFFLSEGDFFSSLPTITEIAHDSENTENSLSGIELEYDAEGNITNISREELIAYVSQMNMSLEGMCSSAENYDDELQSSINSAMSENDIEAAYLEAMKCLMKVKKGIELGEEELKMIGYIANECVNELGPAVDIAKGIAMMNKIPYEEDLDCNRGRLSEKRNGETNFKTNLSISPNPVSSFINIPFRANEKSFS